MRASPSTRRLAHWVPPSLVLAFALFAVTAAAQVREIVRIGGVAPVSWTVKDFRPSHWTVTG